MYWIEDHFTQSHNLRKHFAKQSVSKIVCVTLYKEVLSKAILTPDLGILNILEGEVTLYI